MNANTVWWLIFLALIKKNNPFVLEQQELTATEGSCVEIKCKNTNGENLQNLKIVNDDGWFWMKDAKWNGSYFDATIVYSKHKKRTVSPLFEKRVQYIVDQPTKGPERLCHIRICDLQKTDSGNYSFRFDNGETRWKTKPETNLTVLENPCPITFQKPLNVVENHEVTLTCSTSSSCPLNLTINSLKQPHSTDLSDPSNTLNSPRTSDNMTRSITYRFKANWKDDGIEFSCQTSENKDKYLIRKFSLTVEYAPRNVRAEKSSEIVKKGDRVTLTCSVEGPPNVTFSWFKNDKELNFFKNEMNLTSAEDSHNGLYFCEAKNKHGNKSSNILNITVLYAPEVTVEELPKTIIEGERISLKCNVKRSQPPPRDFVWRKDGTPFRDSQTYNFTSIRPEDSGNYSCTATNTVGSGTSNSFPLRVHYKPRSSVSIDGTDNKDEVSVNGYITFTCNTSAYPEPWYSWFSYNRSDPSHRIYIHRQKKFSFKSVQRVHEACYTCNASNSIGEGETSQPKCIRVRFPPTNLTLSLDSKVKEGNSVTITCSAKSFPPSTFTFKRLHFQSPEWQVISKPQPSNNQNTFSHSFTATPAHNGSYICIASNRENTTASREKILIVEYRPKDVTILPSPELVVKENDSFSLNCSALSNPPAKLFTWTKDGDNQFKKITQRYFVVSASPSDSGRYSCRADNEIGHGNSPKIEVKIKYAPKQTTIIKEKEVQQSDGKRSVKLTCKSNGFPPAKYSWYSKRKIRVSAAQDYTVHSDKAEECYCVAENDMGKKSSELIKPFDDTVKKMVLLGLFICFFFIVLLLFISYRYKRKRAVQRGTANTWSCVGSLAWWTRSRRRDPVTEMGLVGPSRSRDELLTDQPFRLNPQRHQTRPDVTSASNINTVYSTVALPHAKQAPSAQKPATQQGGHKEDDSLNYASLHFQKKQKKPEEDDIYSQVSKPKPPKEKEEGRLGDYENVSLVHAVNPSNIYESDTDTSEDEEGVSYTQVNIRQQRAKRNSSSSEDATEYSQVKI